MMMQRIFPILVITLAMGAIAAHARAGDAALVYKWVDAAGLTHYSEIPPAEGTLEVQTLAFAPHEPVAQDPRTEYYSVVNQARRMQADRLALERARMDRRASEQVATVPEYVAEQQSSAIQYFPVIARPPFPARHHRAPRRDHVEPGHPTGRALHRVERLAGSAGLTHSVTGRPLSRIERIANGSSLLEP